MAASRYDFSIEQGASFRMSITYKDSQGNPIDITNWCARLTWITNTNITQSFVSTNINHSIYKYIIDGPNGKITLLFPATITNNFSFENAKYDLELQSDADQYIDGGKYTIRLLYGVINILPRYSKSLDSLDCQS